MRLLLDQNLSPRLVGRLSELYPASAHVSERGLSHAQDTEVWEYARSHDFIIVSKDGDFSEMSLVYGFPPKVIWMRRGNCSTQEIESLLQKNHLAVKELWRSTQYGILVLR